MEKQVVNLEFERIKSKLARALKEHLLIDATPPPEEGNVDFEMHIPYHQIQPTDEELTARARITYVVRCPKEKVHTVHIEFNYDKTGKLSKETIHYV
jgi:hypothetical protein